MTRSATILVLSGLAWVVYFYAVDRLIMAAQGLPVTWFLMPAS